MSEAPASKAWFVSAINMNAPIKMNSSRRLARFRVNNVNNSRGCVAILLKPNFSDDKDTGDFKDSLKKNITYTIATVCSRKPAKIGI